MSVRVEREWIRQYFTTKALAEDEDDEALLDSASVRQWLQEAEARRGQPVRPDSPQELRSRPARSVSGARQWRLEGFLERLDAWAEHESPGDGLRLIVTAWVMTRYDDPYAPAAAVTGPATRAAGRPGQRW